MKKRILGIIGGSGLYQIEGLENIKWKKVIKVTSSGYEEAN